MSMRKIYRKIAKEHGVSPKEVREEIQAVISYAPRAESPSVLGVFILERRT